MDSPFVLVRGFLSHVVYLVVMNEDQTNTQEDLQQAATPATQPYVEQTTATETALNEPEQPTPEKSNALVAISNLVILLMAPLLAVFLLVFVFQSYRVDGQSMETTLQHEDRLIVWKLARTWSRVTGHQYVPNRGDIIILKESGLSTYGDPQNSKQLVKRVIALPGERVVVKDGLLTVYNKQYPKGFRPDATLPYGKTTDLSYTPNDVDYTLGPKQLFVCGDNRSNSLDSRSFGPIETNQVVGKLVARILPLSKAKTF